MGLPIEELNAICDMSDAIPALTSLGSWNCSDRASADPCRFSGVTCYDGDTNIAYIDIKKETVGFDPRLLTGTIPNSISDIIYLQMLNIFVTSISGTLPTGLASLEYIFYLSISYSEISGTIPSEFISCPVVFDFSFNKLSGTIPELVTPLRNYVGIRNYIVLSGNRLTGSVPASLLGLDLTYIALDFNQLESLPPIDSTHWSNLEYFYARNNRLEGTIPSGLFMLSSVRQIDLRWNQLSGTFPSELSLSVLKILADHNQLSGEFPALNGEIKDLTVSYNSFTSISADIWQSGSLNQLDLSFNKIDSFPKLGVQGLTTLNLQNNQISSTIPKDLPLIFFLYLANNKISGTIPEELRFPVFVELDLSNNQLSGTIPYLLLACPGLETLSLNDNNLSGTIAPIKAKSLSSLHLENNKLEGTFNIDISLVYLTELYIHNNLLSGTIPSKIGEDNILTKLSLGNNNFGGILQPIRSKQLSYIDLTGLKLCTSFRDWGSKTFSYCNMLNIVYGCNETASTSCTISNCDETVECGVDQCALGTHLCTDGRICIPKIPAGYDCGECPYGKSPKGRFNCDPNLLLYILIPVLGFLALIGIIVGVVVFYKIRTRNEIILPNSWLWDMKRVKEQGYLIKECDTPFWYKDVVMNVKSREKEFLDYLVEHLDFGDIKISRSWAISSITLAIAMNNTFHVQKARFISSPDKFCSESWKISPDNTHKQATMKFFLNAAHQWDWNKDKKITDGLILPVVHGTETSLAWRIAAGGFAALSTLDAGFYGKGIYFSTSAIYTLPYFANKKRPAVLICLVAPGNPFPVTESPNSENNLVGKSMITGYQSHYVVTTSSGMPLAEQYWDKYKKYDEVVVTQESQIVPVFLLEIDTKNIRPLVIAFLDEKNKPPKKERERSENRSENPKHHRSHNEDHSGDPQNHRSHNEDQSEDHSEDPQYHRSHNEDHSDDQEHHRSFNDDSQQDKVFNVVDLDFLRSSNLT